MKTLVALLLFALSASAADLEGLFAEVTFPLTMTFVTIGEAGDEIYNVETFNSVAEIRNTYAEIPNFKRWESHMYGPGELNLEALNRLLPSQI